VVQPVHQSRLAGIHHPQMTDSLLTNLGRESRLGVQLGLSPPLRAFAAQRTTDTELIISNWYRAVKAWRRDNAPQIPSAYRKQARQQVQLQGQSQSQGYSLSLGHRLRP